MKYRIEIEQSKANVCAVCRFSSYSAFRVCCCITNTDIKQDERINQKPSWCPLKEIKEQTSCDYCNGSEREFGDFSLNGKYLCFDRSEVACHD